MDLSIIIPAYNEEESLGELVDWIVRVVNKENLSYEIIFVDDGSNDQTWANIVNLQNNNNNIRGISFRRNYGKSAALNVGFEAAKGNVVITMDADLQDSPDEIPELYRMIIEEKYDLVSGWKKVRHDPISKTLPSKIFNRVVRMISGIPLHDFNCGLKAYRRDVVKSIEVYGEMHRYIPLLADTAGFHRITEKEVKHYERKFGVSKFGIERTIKGFLDLLSVEFMTRFGKRPMHLFGTIGAFVFLVGFLAAAVVGAKKLICLYHGVPAPLVTNNPYFYLALVCMILGTQLFLTGFVAELVTRNAPDRNKYLIVNKLNLVDEPAN